MQLGELIGHLQTVGKDPSRLVFEDELTGLFNRRFLLSFLEHKIRWDEEESFPISLLLIDLDLFKAINDTHGHEAGDEALVFVADLIREVAGERGHPVRYGGDEFVLLLPGVELDSAVKAAEELQALARDRRLDLSSGAAAIGVGVSIGVASARADATNAQDLLRKADTALYASKTAGRNRISVASQVDPQKTFSRTALHRLADMRIAGREREMSLISERLAALPLGESRFLIIEGAPGLGKTTLLHAVARGLSDTDGQRVVRMNGRIQEGFRPYYLVGELLLSLLRSRANGAEDPIAGLSKEEVDYLGHVLPQLPTGLADGEGEDPTRREGIFHTLADIVTRLASGRPLVLLVDDLQYADEASLMLLRLLFGRDSFPILVCATAADSVPSSMDASESPWGRFRKTFAEAVPFEEHRLSPLTRADVTGHIADVFPGIELPAGLGDELTKLTQGNPLFLEEILRKLVTDQKLILEGQRWTVAPLEPGYLPRSLEEIVSQEIEALDSDARQLLEQVSAMGDNVSLSQVSGVSQVSEGRVREFLDRAEQAGLLRTDFHLNDETMRFLGKKVHDIVYGSLQPGRKRELHERVGSYHEDLHQQGLGTSASLLAYHFKRAGDAERASQYDRLRRDLDHKAFDPGEAESYTDLPVVEEDADVELADKPSVEALKCLPKVFRTFLTSVRNLQLYPKDSQPVRTAFDSALGAIEQLLENVETIRLSRKQGALLANGHRVDLSEFRLLARSFSELLERGELESIEFRRSVREEELRALVEELSRTGSPSETIEHGHWRRFTTSRGLTNLSLIQTRYSEVRRRRRGRTVGDVGAPLNTEELACVPRILRALTGAAQTIQLYPLESQPMVQSLSHLEQEVAGLLGMRDLVTFSSAGGALIVNGVKVPTTGFEALAERFLSILREAELTSLTFRDAVNRPDLEAFVQGINDAMKHAGDPSFWQGVADENSLGGIVLNDRRYTSEMLDRFLVDEEGEIEGEDSESSESMESLTDDVALAQALPTLGKQLLEHAEGDRLTQLLAKLFRGYGSRPVEARDDLLRGCRKLMDSVVHAHQHRLAEYAVDYWLSALREETDTARLRELAALLHRAATVALTFKDTTTASRAWSGIRARNRELVESAVTKGAARERRGPILNVTPDASTKDLLLSEVRSSDPKRQELAAEVLESLGQPSIPVLITVIKQEKDYRTRKLAASLLSRMGDDAARAIKREMLLEITTEHRFRILEVIDIVTTDLKKELAFCLTDVNPKVRRASFRLSERLGTREVVELLVDLAHDGEIGVAKGAMKSLATIRSPHAVGAFSAALGVTKDPERVVALVQTLAQLGDPAAVPSLRRLVLEKQKWGFGGFRWSDQVRATAAFALAEIGGRDAVSTLEKLKEDEDPRIREIARGGATTKDSAAAIGEAEQQDD